MSEPHYQFMLIKASKLSMDDDFMKYKPVTSRERKLKAQIEEAISNGVKDFFRPNMDPCVTEKGDVSYILGKRPALGYSYNWWKETAEGLSPGKSRLGTKNEYSAFWGVFIKEIVGRGASISEAWNLVCNESEKLAHFSNSKGATHIFESTGSREAYGFFDLGNTYKILLEDPDKRTFFLAGGNCHCNPLSYPLCSFFSVRDKYEKLFDSVGWIVLEK